MDTRVAILAIVVEERDKAEELNHVLHAYGKYIIGRMGIPYEKRGISLIIYRTSRRFVRTVISILIRQP